MKNFSWLQAPFIFIKLQLQLQAGKMDTKVVNQTGFTLLAGGVSHLINKHNIFFICV